MRQSDPSKSSSPEEWQALAAMSDNLIRRPAGLSLQVAQLIPPGAPIREEQNLAAHRFSLEVRIETIQATKDS